MTDENNTIEPEEPPVSEEEVLEETPDADPNAVFDAEEQDDAINPVLKDDEISFEELFSGIKNPESSDIEGYKSLTMLAHTLEEVKNKVGEIRRSMSIEKFSEHIANPESAVSSLRDIVDMSEAGDSFYRKQLDYHAGKLSDKYVSEDLRLMDVTPVSNSDKGGKTITGKEAITLIHAKNRNVRKVALYNSGFYIVLKGPSFDDLNVYYNAVSSKIEEYGKEFGVFYYMYADLAIKEATAELIKKLTVYAPVKNYTKGDNLMKAISMQDYRVLLWAVGCLMYRKGFPYTYVCANLKKCNYRETEQVDLHKLRHTNYSAMTPEALKFMGSNDIRTLVELESYRKMLGFESDTIDLYGPWKVRPKVATIQDVIDYGTAFNSALIDHVHLEDKDSILRFIQFNFYKIFVPWIKELRYYKDDGGIDFKIVEKDAIAEALDISQLEKSNFGEDIENYITKTALSHIAIPFDKCPGCGYVPTYAKTGYIAFDVQKSFFIQLVMRLAQGY